MKRQQKIYNYLYSKIDKLDNVQMNYCIKYLFRKRKKITKYNLFRTFFRIFKINLKF